MSIIRARLQAPMCTVLRPNEKTDDYYKIYMFFNYADAADAAAAATPPLCRLKNV